MSPDGERRPKSEQPEMDFRSESSIPAPAPAHSIEATGATGLPHSVELHIEELTLNGFEAGDHHRISDALERELARLITERGVPRFLAQNNEAGMLAAQEFYVAEGSTPEAIGAQVAQAIYRGLYR
jgi:hypothetical protein